jgi:hypothetical protein
MPSGSEMTAGLRSWGTGTLLAVCKGEGGGQRASAQAAGAARMLPPGQSPLPGPSLSRGPRPSARPPAPPPTAQQAALPSHLVVDDFGGGQDLGDDAVDRREQRVVGLPVARHQDLLDLRGRRVWWWWWWWWWGGGGWGWGCGRARGGGGAPGGWHGQCSNRAQAWRPEGPGGQECRPGTQAAGRRKRGALLQRPAPHLVAGEHALQLLAGQQRRLQHLEVARLALLRRGSRRVAPPASVMATIAKVGRSSSAPRPRPLWPGVALAQQPLASSRPATS